MKQSSAPIQSEQLHSRALDSGAYIAVTGGYGHRRRAPHWRVGVITLLLGFLILLAGRADAQQESLCAQVKIEIKQELTLERQAFDAHMRINNGLDNLSLENVQVDVNFADADGNSVLGSSDPNNTDASFFIRLDTLSGINDIAGNGTVQPASSADIHWLIIPAPGSGGQSSAGTLYYVGATLRYTLGGQEQITEVTPDYIFVKPMPLLTLDYFLTRDVYADDPFTPEIEPPEPFTLGLRVTNTGNGVAHDLRIDSAQPRIIDNEQGLLINFQILSSTVNNQPPTSSPLVAFGELAPNASAVARWQLQTTLSGQFVDFSADFSHADELGGELTSLLAATNTHTLIHNVLVDLPGRDQERDYLARDGDVLRVYESNGVDTDVTEQSGNASLALAAQDGGQVDYALNAPPTAGFLYVQLPDPHDGSKRIARALRSDGKLLPEENVWLSRTRREDNGWDHFINLFDANSSGQYLIRLDDVSSGPQPPVLQFIRDHWALEGEQVVFLVEASDPNGTLPVLTAAPLPIGASFVQENPGTPTVSTYAFDWTPAIGQAGVYDITFTASDGELKASQATRITVCSITDPNCGGEPVEVSLHEGFNLFVYPVQVPAEHATCQALFADLANPQEIESIARLNTQAGIFEHCDDTGGADFPIQAGEGYILRMYTDKAITFTGRSVCPQVSLAIGPNLVGYPTPPAELSCFDVLNAFGKEVVSAIQHFNPSNGAFETCAFFDPGDGAQPAGANFHITAGEGLIVHAKTQIDIPLPGCQD